MKFSNARDSFNRITDWHNGMQSLEEVKQIVIDTLGLRERGAALGADSPLLGALPGFVRREMHADALRLAVVGARRGDPGHLAGGEVGGRRDAGDATDRLAVPVALVLLYTVTR